MEQSGGGRGWMGLGVPGLSGVTSFLQLLSAVPLAPLLISNQVTTSQRVG